MRRRERCGITNFLVVGCVFLSVSFPCYGEVRNEIVLVPIGEIDNVVMANLRSGLEKEMGIHFSILPDGIEPRTQEQEEEDAALSLIASDVLQRFPEPSRATILADAGVADTDLANRQGKRKLVLHYLKKYPSPEFDRLAGKLGDAASAPPVSRYGADRLLYSLEARHRNNRVRGHLGVTTVGLSVSATDKRPSPGTSTPGYGVLTLSTPWLQSPTLDPSIRDRRLLRMAIRFSLDILGVSPCLTPDCPYTRIRSTSGIRREDPRLCDECRERLGRVLRPN